MYNGWLGKELLFTEVPTVGYTTTQRNLTGMEWMWRERLKAGPGQEPVLLQDGTLQLVVIQITLQSE
jgi:hypothetical protein